MRVSRVLYESQFRGHKQGSLTDDKRHLGSRRIRQDEAVVIVELWNALFLADERTVPFVAKKYSGFLTPKSQLSIFFKQKYKFLQKLFYKSLRKKNKMLLATLLFTFIDKLENYFGYR